MEASLTASDLVEALRAASEAKTGPDDARTVWELQRTMGLGDKAVRKRVRLAIERGEVEFVMVSRTSMNGVAVTVPAYRLKGTSAQG